MPILTVIAGPNGSGKTTLTRKLLSDQTANHINPDDMAKEMSESAGRSLAECERIAFVKARDLQIEYQNNLRSYSYETVMSHPSHIERMRDARSKGFHVRLAYIYLSDPVENVERVAMRFKMGGHNIPEDKIVDRYHRSITLLPRAVREADAAIAMSNDGADYFPAGLRLVSRDGYLQVSEHLQNISNRITNSDVPAWLEYGYHQGLSSSGWTEYCLDPDLMATNRLRLEWRRKQMLEVY